MRDLLGSVLLFNILVYQTTHLRESVGQVLVRPAHLRTTDKGYLPRSQGGAVLLSNVFV
jgi:hypothetical protein